MFYVFAIPLFGIIFNVFYQVGLEGEASYIVQHPFVCLYPLPDYGRMNGRNLSCRNNNEERIVFGCCVVRTGLLL